MQNIINTNIIKKNTNNINNVDWSNIPRKIYKFF